MRSTILPVNVLVIQFPATATEHIKKERKERLNPISTDLLIMFIAVL